MREGDRSTFVELASRLVSKVMRDIQLVGNLSNRSNYHYTDADVSKISSALYSEVGPAENASILP